MAQNLVRGSIGESIGGTINLAGWGVFNTLPPVSLEEDNKQVFPPATQSRRIYLLNEGPGEIQISFGATFNPDSPLFLSPGYLFEEESEEALWGKGFASLKRMTRFRATDSTGEGETPAPAISILAEGDYSGMLFVPSASITTVSVVSGEFFRDYGYNTEWIEFLLYRSESEADFADPRNLAIYQGGFYLEPPDYTLQSFEIPFYPGNFYCLVASQNFLMMEEISFLAYDGATNTLTLS